MSKEKNATAGGSSEVNPLVRELFQTGIYKRSQGKIARQMTFGAIVLTLLLGCWRLSVFLGTETPWETYLPFVLFFGGTWLAFRLVNYPPFADFLIQVEVEMNKVSWPTRGELFRSSVVVIFCILFLTAVLFSYDLFWRWLLHALHIVDIGK